MNLNKNLYEMIYKRKSFHLFRNVGDECITSDEMKDIEEIYKKLVPLYPDIKTAIKIVPGNETSYKCGQEYCILMYSEKKDNYLQNIGYIGEQLDLYLVSKNIGTLWLGLGKTKEKSYEGLDYVIMIAIKKVDDETKFRKDMFKSKRKSIDEIWKGETISGVTDIARFAPSACNSQPWIVERKDNKLAVYRLKKRGKVGIMLSSAASYFNRIDMGIYLCFLELCLKHNEIGYDVELFDDKGGKIEKTLVAEYRLK